MAQWKPTPELPKSKAQLREVLAEAVRNTAHPKRKPPKPPKPPPKAKS
jgi:hypothetical protein